MMKIINVSIDTCVIIILLLIGSCSKDSNTTPSNSTGGAGNTTGNVTINTSWPNPAPWNACNIPYTVVVGLGYNSNDVANEAYFAEKSFYYSPASYTKNDLPVGIYYYKVKKTFNTNCGTGLGIPPTVTKSGSFSITAGQMTTVNAGVLQ